MSPQVSRDTQRQSQDNRETDPLLPPYSKHDQTKKHQNGSECVAARHVLAFLAFLGFFNVYCLRVNLSVAVVAMVNSNDDNTSSSTECPDPNINKTSTSKSAEFDWDGKTQGLVLGSFFYGYITTQIPGGWLASRIGGKNLFGFGVLCTALLTLITPVAVRYSVYLFIAVRVLEGIGENLKTPWKEIFTSPAVLACCIAHFCYNWGFYTLLTCLPKYMKSILKFNMKENGLLSALPYLVLWIMQNACGILADFIRRNGYLSTKVTRKVFNSAGLALPGIFLIFVGYVGCNHVLAMLMLTLSVGLGGAAMGGFNVNHLDIAPKFAGSLMGITNCIATVPGFVAPAVVGYLTNDHNTRHQWQIIFYISASVFFAGAIMYALLSEGEEQPWARKKIDTFSNCKTVRDIIQSEHGIQDEVLVVGPPSPQHH
ncbi:vesicular glutamate transporter [Elysia marginata]|uniref:Vesicular glutamate transporter n=1 Tax=Elysia marginata TaxID=1093978 RepID=A0AAV4HAJ9_9GAST|nr:vesicular glutamate transporter [Elysia marginata]